MTSPQRPSEGSDTPQPPQQPQQPDWSVLLPREGEPVGPPPVGAAPPGSPTGATPPPQPPRPPRAVPQPSRNGFAIASLILGILGSGFLLGIVFGVVALVQITAKGQRGRGMAIVGILLSVLWIVAAVAAVAIGLYLARDDVAAANNVKVGDCITNIPDASHLGELVATSCANPHKAEVVGVVKLSGSDFPGGQTLSKQGEDACRRP